MIDAHNHLHFQAFDEDRDDVVERAREAGVTAMVLAGYDSARRDLAARLARRAGIFATAGLHPWALRDLSDEDVDAELSALETLDWAPCCALGELGLDAAIDIDHHLQRRVFVRQLALARERDLPLVVHSVRANDEVAQVLEKEGVPGRGGIIHSFWGTQQQAERFVRLGLSLSVGTQLTKGRPAKMVEALDAVGLEALLVETDAPSRPPAGVKSRRNEPAHLSCVVDALALVLRTSREEVADATARNARKIFDLRDEALAAVEK